MNESVYRIKPDKKEYSKGEPVTFLITATDANGFSLLDTRVNIKAKVNYTSKYLADLVFVPNNLWSTEQNLDPLGETKIVMPDSVFPDAVMDIEIKATFNNSNNETHDTSFSITYSGATKKLALQLDSQLIKADYLVNGKSIAHKGKLIKRIQNNSIEEDITYPYKERFDIRASDIEFVADDLSKDLFDYENGNHYHHFYIGGYRTKDSVFINTENKYGLEATYTILRGVKEIEKGTSSNVNKRIKDESKDTYYVRYHFIWRGEAVDYTSTIQQYEKAISVKVEQPEDIYPGQKTNVKIKVTDVNKKPIENVNLTAYAINSQFDISNIQNMPYLGARYGKRTNNDKYELTAEDEYEGNLSLTRQWQQKMHLDTMAYYKMLYPKNGMHYNYDSVKTINAQFAPFLFDKGNRVPVYIVFIDNYPVYYYDTDNATEYAFVTSVGYHTINLRTIDKDYRIDSVFLPEGVKTDLALDINNLPKTVTVFDKTNKLTLEEKTSIRNSVIFVYSTYGGVNYVWQNNRVVASDETYSKTLHKYGGFFPKQIYFAKQNEFVKSFLFEPGYDYEFTADEIKMRANSFCQGDIFLGKNNRLYPKMGLKAGLLNSIKLKTQENWYKDFATYSPRNTSEGNGTYDYQYTGDSSICLIRVKKCGNDTLTRFYTKNYYNNVFHDLTPGYYNITFITANKYFIQKDSIKILAGGTLFQRFDDKSFRKYVAADKNDTVRAKRVSKTNWKTPEETSLFNSYVYENLKGIGCIKVTLIDKETKEGIPFANVVVYRNGLQVAVGITDMDGIVSIKPLPSGRYNVKAVYVGYGSQQINDVIVTENKTSYINISISSAEGVHLDAVMIMEYSTPLIDPDTKSGGTIDRESFQNMAAKDINSVVSTQAGVILTDNNSNTAIQVRGSRAGTTNVFIDGERVIGTTNLPQSAVEELGGIPGQYGDITGGVTQIRSKFSDCAFWKPNLITDKNGEASFSVTFPENVTQWKSYAIAMDDKRHSGIGHAYTKAYKNIMANLAMPRFLLPGDSSQVIGKTLNYTDKKISVNTQLKINNIVQIQHDTMVQNAIIEKFFISPFNTDSLKATYAVQQFEGSKDCEERTIPVLPLGVEEINGMFFVLNHDTTFSLNIDTGVTEIYIQDNPLDFMLKEIEQLKKYPYWCMEQTASKLNAFLMEEKIKNKLHQKFTNGKQAVALIHKLEKAQKPNGSWGWWQDSQENIWMTSYIARILNEAKMTGYSIENLQKAKQYLLWNLSALKGNELLSVLNTFSEMNISVPYAEYLKRFEKDTLSLYQEFLITKIKQGNKLAYDMTLINKTKKETVLKSTYWGNDNYGWYDNSTNMTLLAYKIIEANDSNNFSLQSIRNYFLEIRNQHRWRNTIETANILETILPGFLKQSGNEIKPASVSLKGAIDKTVSVFPYKTTVSKNEKLIVTKTGSSPIFFTSYQTKWNGQPQKKQDYYNIRTYYEVDGKKIDTLKAGVLTDLVVEVIAAKKADYVMIEVPIPAGCSYDDNKLNINYYEAHREYFKNKTSIFCQELSQGKHIFKIKLQPRFSGSYNINPTKAELMYFPVFYGRNEIKKTNIK